MPRQHFALVPTSYTPLVLDRHMNYPRPPNDPDNTYSYSHPDIYLPQVSHSSPADTEEKVRILTIKPSQTNMIITRPRTPTPIPQLIRPAITPDHNATLHAIGIIRTSAALVTPTIILTRRCPDADSVAFPIPCGFAARAATVEGGEGCKDEGK